MEEREDLRDESFVRRSCHRPMKVLIEREERMRRERRWLMSSRVVM